MISHFTLPPERGLFISFEGCDGSGKSTQVRLLGAALETLGISVVLTRESGGSIGGEAIRQALMLKEADWDGISDVLLHNAGRRNHITQTILPALARGAWVISDRFFDSTNAYQGAGRGVPQDILQAVQEIAIGDFKPDITLVLSLPMAEGLARQQGRDQGGGDRFEAMERAVKERIYAFYEALPALEPQRCVALNAAQSPEIVHDEIKDIFKKRFGVPFYVR